jgi:putative spermidine/putrescine transport system substrate-binding protein
MTDEQKYQKHAERLWDYINRIKPYFWKEGETFPSTPAALNQLFSNGEINFSMSFGTRIDQSVSDGTYPGSARVYVWDSGTIKNANYVGIPKNSGRKAGAMVVANFLLSPEAQYNKMLTKYMASNTVLAMDELPQDWQQKFEAISESDYAPPSKVLEDHALQELGPEYMIHLYEDFRTEVIQQ